MAADDGRGSQRGARESASSRNSNTNNSARGDARESRSQESSRSGSGSGVGTNAPSRGTGSNAGPSRSSGASDRNNGQTAGRESRGVAAGSVGAVGRENDRSIGRGLAGAAGLDGGSLGSNVTSTYQGRPSSVASAALSRQSLAPDRAMPTGPVRGRLSATGFGPLGDMAASAYGAVKSAIAPTFNSAMASNREIDGFVDKMIGVESANNPKAKNPLSSATGLGQFLSSTWMNTVRQYRPDLTENYSAPEVLAMRTDPVLSRQMTKAYAIDNAKALQKQGLPVTKETVYAAHFLGPVGAVKAYKADPTTPAATVLGSAVVNANPNIMSGKTIGDVLGYVSRVMNKPENGGFATTPANAPTPADKPSVAERFSSTYLGRPASVATSMARNNLARDLPSPASSFPARPAGPVSTNLGALDRPNSMPSRELMSDAEQAATFGEQPGGAPVAPREVRPTSPSPTTVDPAYSVRPVSPTPNSPEIAPTVPSTPVPAVSATPVAPAEETTVKAPLTTGQKVIAGGIDVGVGLIPGVGLAATVYNGLASLTGQPTIGGMAVDLLGGGSDLGTGGPRRNEESGRRSNYEPPEPKEPESTIKKPPETERFRERYLIPVVNRPTPSQKWGRRAARDRPPA